MLECRWCPFTRWIVVDLLLSSLLVLVTDAASLPTTAFDYYQQQQQQKTHTQQPLRALGSSLFPEFFACPVCPLGINVSFPDLVVGNNDSVTCGYIDKLGHSSSFDSYNCAILQQVTDVQSKCGCPTMAPTPQAYPTCNICGGSTSTAIGGQPIQQSSPQLLVTNFGNIVTNIPTFGNISCADLQLKGTSNSISPLLCTSLPRVAYQTCGCEPVSSGGPSCPQATAISAVGQVELGQTFYSVNNSTYTPEYLSFCSITINSWSWYTFVGTGVMVTAHTCHYSSVSTQVLVINGTCSSNNCTVSSYEPCIAGASSGGSATTWLAEAGVEYHIVVGGGNIGTLPTPGDFALTIAPSCNICGARGKRATNLEAYVQVPSGSGNINITCFELQRQAMLGLWMLGGDTANSENASSLCLNVQADFSIQQACGCAFFLPGPSQCSNAVTIVANEITHGTTTTTIGTNASTVDNLTGFGTFPATRAWYRYVGTGETVIANTCTYVANYINGITIFNGTCNSLGLLTQGQPGCDTNAYGATATWFAEANQEYFILVAGDLSLIQTFILDLIVEAPSPTMAPTAYFNRTVCNICGVNGVVPTYALQNVDVPFFGNISCGDLQFYGTNGSINTSTCSALLATNITQRACGCYEPGSFDCSNATTVSLGEPTFGRIMPLPNEVNYTFCGETLTNPVWYNFEGVGENVTINIQSCTAVLVILEGSCDKPYCVATDSSGCGAYQQHVPEVTIFTTLGQSYSILVYTDNYVYPDVEGNFVLTVSKLSATTHTYTPNFPVCHICGSNTERVTLGNETIGNGNFNIITCGELEQNGLENKTAPAVCSILLLQGLHQKCGCQAVADTSQPSSMMSYSPSAAFRTFVPSAVGTYNAVQPSTPLYSLAPHPAAITSQVSGVNTAFGTEGFLIKGKRT